MGSSLHALENLTQSIATALKADSTLMAIIQGGTSGVYTGLDFNATNDWESMPRPFINVTNGRSPRTFRHASKFVKKASVIISFVEDQRAASGITTYNANLKALENVLEAVALESINYDGDKAIVSDDDGDGYENVIEIDEDGKRTTTILMKFHYHQERT